MAFQSFGFLIPRDREWKPFLLRCGRSTTDIVLDQATSYQALFNLGNSCVDANLTIQAWAKELPRSALELLWSGETEDAERWFYFHGKPVLLYCTLSNARGIGMGSGATHQITDTVWQWCGKTGGRGYWTPTHRMEFKPNGQLSVTLEPAADDDAEEASWEVSSSDDQGAVSSIKIAWRNILWDCCVGAFSMSCTSTDGAKAACYIQQHNELQEPRTYITLQEENVATFPAGGTVRGTDVRTQFQKVRLEPDTSKIYCPDFRFTTSTGRSELIGGNGSCRSDVTHAMYGVAQNSGGAQAMAVVDLQGTPFSVISDWAHYGYSGRGWGSKTCNSQRVDVIGSGYQGGCGPNGHNSTLSNGAANDQWAHKADNCKTNPFRISIALQE